MSQSGLSIWIYWILLLMKGNSVRAWHGDRFYFTSFENVSEWELMYDNCNPSFDYVPLQIHNISAIPHTLSPIPLPAPNDTPQVDLREEPQVLLIYNNPPPAIGSYSVSFASPKNKQCVSNSFFQRCYVSPSLNQIRAVVLSAERTQLTKIKEEFTVEEPEKFVTILNGGSKNERKFHEAMFLGNPKGSDGERSTHTIGGKAYPMEIYLFFIDETYPAMALTTILVVLVEEQEEDNPVIRPISSAVSHHLYQEERKFLKLEEINIQREKMYHHLGESTVFYGRFSVPLLVKSSAEVEKAQFVQLEYWEKSLALSFQQLFDIEDIEFLEGELGMLQKSLDAMVIVNVTDKYLGFFDAVVKNDLKGLEPKSSNDILESLELGCKDCSIFDSIQDAILLYSAAEFRNYQNRSIKGKLTPDKRIEQLMQLEESENELLTTLLENIFKEVKKLEPVLGVTIPDALEPFLNARFQMWVNFIGYNTSYEIIRESINKKTTEEGWGVVRIVDLNKDVQADINDFFSPPEKNQFVPPGHMPLAKHLGPVERGNLGMTPDEWQKTYNLTKPVKVQLKHKFQVSWLLPDGGGYYIYTGSSPVPPCFKADKTIVFRKPLKMSKSQIEGLTVMPTSFSKMRDIKNTLPRLHKLRRPDFPVHFEKRNHQFLRNDGVHKNSVLEASRRRAEISDSANPQRSVSITLAAISISINYLI